jgi:hypothetical protein
MWRIKADPINPAPPVTSIFIIYIYFKFES